MTVTYTSKDYNPKKKYKRYVRLDGNGVYYFCEVENGYDVAQGIAYESEIRPDVAAKAQSLQGYFPSYVDWPYD